MDSKRTRVGAWTNGAAEVITDQQMKTHEVTQTAATLFMESERANSDDNWPLRVVTRKEAKMLVQVQHGGESKKYQAEEILEAALTQIRRTMEKYTGNEIKGVVTAVADHAKETSTQKSGDGSKDERAPHRRQVNRGSVHTVGTMEATVNSTLWFTIRRMTD